MDQLCTSLRYMMDKLIIKTKNFTWLSQKCNSRSLDLGIPDRKGYSNAKEIHLILMDGPLRDSRRTLTFCCMLIQPRDYIIENLENCIIWLTFQYGVVCTFVEAQLLVLALCFLIQSFTHGRVSNQIILAV